MTALAFGNNTKVEGLTDVAQDPVAFVTTTGAGSALDILVRGARCANCLGKIEGALGKLPGMQVARLNLSTGKLRTEWAGPLPAKRIIQTLVDLGYGAAAYDAAAAADEGRSAERRLLFDLAVAAAGSAGVMLMSEALWFGGDVSADTRALLHWLSALIALPATAFAGRSFFASAAASLRRWRLNMDVPISLAVVLALTLSMAATLTGGTHTYFDASVMLLFFLLIGRYLDARLRRRAYSSANALAALQVGSATRLSANGAPEAVRVADIRPGHRLLLAAGERLAVDAEVVAGSSSLDLRLVTGEVEPAMSYSGQVLHAGTVNLSASLQVRAIAAAGQSLVADIGRMLEAGEQKKSSYRRIADKAVAAYVPQVHLTALLGFAGWLIAGSSIEHAAFIAVSVLIITCPCAIALAAPLVQVVAAGRLFREGAYLASGDALERIAAVQHVVLDKTGTLTLGEPVLLPGPSQAQLALAAQLARGSRHPFSRALARAAGPGSVALSVEERPGEGVTGLVEGKVARLGSAAFVGLRNGRSSQLWLQLEGQAPVAFSFEDRLREDARAAVDAFEAMGLTVELLSGDAEERVERAAAAAGIRTWTAGATPQSKAAHIEHLNRMGRKVLMIGDGFNDAAALAGAYASFAPGGALDITRLAADCVYTGDSLAAAPRIVAIARAARQRMRENFAVSFAYNALAIPVALAGWATPLVAAAAMSASSALVTLNALRMSIGTPPQGGRR